MSILISIYVAVALLLTIYGFNAWVLTLLCLKNRHKTPPLPDVTKTPLPPITVQLPIYNEAHVVTRLIDAVAQLDYPRRLLQIQILDDSTDATTDIAATCVCEYRALGYNITLLHRTDRDGFKAGALKDGLAEATGDFIIIFDADFVPNPNFIQQTLPYLLADPELGFVQTRWGHLNRTYSRLTATQALAIDGHFIVEQTARNRSGLMMNFNGTAGIWRRSCIESAGGWHTDTICEDFDLSYRALFAGWRCLFLPHVVAPAELPPQLAAFKRQQFRWAKGSMQCLRKLWRDLLHAPFSVWVKLQAFIHLSSYMAHPLLVLVAFITPLLLLTGSTANIQFPLIYLSFVSLGPPTLYAVAQVLQKDHAQSWWQRYKSMPWLMLLGCGIALHISQAVIEAWLGRGHTFRRTPKFNVVQTTDRWQHSQYRLPVGRIVFAELAFSLYSFLGVWIAITQAQPWAVPFILLYALGFGYVGILGLWESRLALVAGLFPAQQQPSSQNETHEPVI